MGFDVKRFLSDLRNEVEMHPAVNHVFLMRIATSPFTREDYKVFGLQHYPLVGNFTTYLERLLINGPDSNSKSWIAKVLVDEYGEGSDGKDHAELYREYLTACGVAEGEEDTVVLDAAVVDFIRTHLDLSANAPFLVGLGALGPGHEWAIPRMFVPIIEGQERAGFTDDEICYFKLHCLQDVDHALWLEEALAELIDGPEDAALVRQGTLLSLEARARFWSGGQSRVVRWRQPAQAWDFREHGRRWLGRQHPWVAKLPLGRLTGHTAVYRPQLQSLR